MQPGLPPMHSPVIPSVTVAQLNFLVSLYEQLEGSTPEADRLAKWSLYSRREASETIDTYKQLVADKREKERQARQTYKLEFHGQDATDSVPEGRYAVEDNNGVLKFYKVDKPTEGKWSGYTFVKEQASDDYYPVKNPASRTHILELIAEDPQRASTRYGQEIGCCGVCGRTLTDEASRAAGIGPICQQKMNW